MRSLPVILLSCCLMLPACSPSPQQGRLLWQNKLPGTVQLQPDNGMLYYDGSSFTLLDADLQSLASRSAIPGTGAAGSFTQMMFSISYTTPMYEGPAGMFLCNSYGQYQLVNRDKPLELITLESPLTGENASTGILRNSAGLMCFLAGRALVLQQYQLLVAYDLRGRQLWQFMADDSSVMYPSAAGDRLLVASRIGNVYCLDADGNLLWQRTGSYMSTGLGKQLLLADQLSGGLLCLDWDGKEIWQREFPAGALVQVLSGNAACGRALVNLPGRLLCLDGSAATLWQASVPEEGRSSLLLADDGYAFQLYEHYGSSGILGGRIARRAGRQAQWTCYTPAGQRMWVFNNVPDYADGAVAGSQGHLFMSDLNSREFSCYGPPAP